MRFLVVLILVSASACFYEFDRLNDLEPGEIAGAAIEDDTNEIAAFARIEPAGASKTFRARRDGSFSVRGLPSGTHVLRFAQDADGDGFLDRGAYRAVSLREDAEGDLSKVLLGSVRL